MSVSDAEEAVDRAVSNAEEAVGRVESELEERTDGEPVPMAKGYARRAAGSGVLAGVGGSVSLLRGLRAIRRGNWGRGLVRVLLGALFLGVAAVQRRSTRRTGGDATDVVDTSPDIEDVGTDESAGESGRHAGEEAAAVADTSPDVGDLESATDDGGEAESGAASDRNESDAASDVVDTGPDIESVDRESKPDRDASDDEVADVGGSSPDVGDLESATDDEEAAETDEGTGDGPDRNGDGATAADTGAETDTETDTGGEDGSDAEPGAEDQAGSEEGEPDRDSDQATPEAEDSTDAGDGEPGAGPGERTYERLGEAAFDEHGREIPAPQRAFDLNLLSLDHEAFWGIRESDDAVFVSVIYDSLGEGTKYVASSRVDEDRMLQVPDAVTDHWDEVAGGGTAVTGGDELVFAIAENAAGDRLRVVPAKWADDVPGLEGAEE